MPTCHQSILKDYCLLLHTVEDFATMNQISNDFFFCHCSLHYLHLIHQRHPSFTKKNDYTHHSCGVTHLL